MPIEDKVQSLLDVLESDKNYKGAYDYKTLSSDLSDKNKAKELFDVLENDKNYKGSFSNVDELMALKKKEPTTPQGQGILKSGFGESASGGTNADFGSTTITKKVADKAQKELKTVPPTPENPLGVHPDNLKLPTENSSVTIQQQKPIPESVYKIPTVTSQQIAKKNYDITVQQFNKSNSEAQQLQQELEQSQPEFAKIQNDMQAEFQIAGEDIHKTLAPQLQQKVNNKEITVEDANNQLKKAQEDIGKQIQSKYTPLFAKQNDKYNLYLEKKSDAELQYNRAVALEKTTGIIDRNLQAKEISDQKLQFKDIQSTFMAGMYMMNKIVYGALPIVYRAQNAVNYMGEGVGMDEAFMLAEQDVKASPIISSLDELASEQAKLYETKKAKITKTTGTADDAFSKGDYLKWGALEGLNFVEFMPTMLAQSTIGVLTGGTTSVLTPLAETAAFGAQQYYGEIKDREDMSERQKFVNAITGGALFAMAGHIMRGLVSPMTNLVATAGKEEVQKTIANTISTSMKTGLSKSLPLFKPFAGATEMYALGYSQTWENALTDPNYKGMSFEQIHDEATKTGTSMMGMGLVGSLFGTIPEYIKSDLYVNNNKKAANETNTKIDEIDAVMPTLDETMQRMMAQKKMELTGALNAIILKDTKETEHLNELQKQKLIELNQTGNDIQDLLDNTEIPIEGEPRKVLEDNLKQIEKGKEELIKESLRQGEKNLKAEPAEPQKTDKDYQQAQEINTRISKEHPNASVLIQPKGEDLSLTAIYVGKNNRGKGIGSKVLESVKSEADKVGKKVVLDATNELDKETDIKRLGEFYEKNGFKKVGENKFEYEPKSQVEPITPKEGDIVELQPRVKGGMKPQAVFKDGKWQAKVGKETSEIGKTAQEEAQTAFESSNKPTLEPKNEVNGGKPHQPYAGKSVVVKGAPKGNHLNVGLFEGDTDRLMTHNEVLAMLPKDVKILSYKEVQGTEPTLSIEISRKLTDDEVTKLLSETKQLAISQLSEGIGVLHKNGSPEAEAWGEFNPEFFVTQEGKSLLEHAKSPEIIPEEVHTPIVSRLSKMGFAIKSLAGDSWHSAVELAKKGGAKFMSFGGYEKTGFEETKEYKDLVKSGHIVENFNILGIKGRPVYITSPDNMMVGDIHFGDTHVIKGEGGVHFVSKTGHVWAFKKGANTMVKFINEEIKKNGSANIVLTKGGLGKTLNTHEGAIGAMRVLEDLTSKGYISLDRFKNALTAVGVKYNIKFSDKGDIKSIHESIKKGFYERGDSTFENRGTFVRDFVKEITSGIKRDKKSDIEAIKKALNTDRTLGKDITLNRDNVIDAIGGLFSDEMTLDVPIGYAYAVIQVSSEVKPVNIDKTEGGHAAYPEHVVTIDGSRPKLLIIDKPQYIGDIANNINNNVVVNKKDVKGNVKYPHQQLGSNNTGFAEGVMKTAFTNKGKGEKGTDLIESGGKRKQMTEDDKGNYLFFHYSKTKFNKLNPKKVGTHLATGRDERTATPVSSLYTRPDVGEANVPNDFGYVVRVPKDKVYDFNSDPLNLKKEAEARFKKENPNRAFDANNKLAEVAKLAAEKGFQVTVADWNIKGTKTLIAKTSESLPLENYNNIKLGTMNQIEFAKGMEDIKANAKRRDIKYNDVSVKYMTDANGNIFGFVKDGEITLNGDKKTANTPIHEAGHIWIGKVKEKNPELYKAGMDKVDGSKYLEDVKNEKLYQDEAAKLPEDMQEDYFKEEALAKAIGDNGERFATDAKKSDFKTWVLSMWKAVAKEFGLHNMSPEEVSKLTLDEFSKKAAADILGGKGENAPENLKKLAEDNSLPSFRNVVNLVNKYVREVKLEEGKTITDAEVKQALKNKEEGVTREGWVSKTEKPIERETTGITREQTEQVAKDLGLHDYEAKPEEIADWDAEADKRLRNNPNTIPDLLKRLETGGKTDKVDTRVMLRYMQSLEAKIVKNPSNELISEYSKARDLKDAVLSKEVAQQLVALKGTVAVEDSLAELLIAKKESSGVDDLTDAQKADVKKMFDELQAAKAEVEDLKKQVQDADNKLAAEGEIKKTRVSSKKRTHAEYVAERQDLKEQWSAALKKARGTMGANMPMTSEMAAIIAKMMKSYVSEGLSELSEIVNKIHTDIGGSVEKDEIRDAIGGSYAKAPKTRNELSAISLNLKTEAALLKKIQDLENGIEPKTEKAKVEKNQKLADLRKQIKDSDIMKLSDIIKRNETATKRVEERIKNKEYTSEKRKSPLDNPDFRKKYPELYKKALDSLHKKEEASRKLEIDRYNDEMSKIKWWGLQNGINTAKGLIATSRAIVAGVDDSFAFVQAGLAMIGNPKEGTKAFKEHILDAFSESRFNREIARVHNSENWNLIHKSGLDILDPASLRKAEHEETFDNNMLKKSITIGGKTFNINKYTLAPFERMFTSLGNHLREYMFLTEAAELMKQGKTFETHPQEFKDIANVVNNMTGRAKLPSKIAGAADLMSPIIWSPKLMASSLNILGLSDVARLAGNKGYYTSMTGGKWNIKDLKGSLKSEMNSPRRYAIEQTARAIGVGASIMAIAAMNGADVDNDPTSVTFGTIQYTKGGNRYRVWGRYTPYIRMVAMIATGKKTTPRGVEELYGTGKHKIVGEFGQFMRGKFTPLAGEAYSLALNKTYSGETFDYAESAKNLIEPMSLKDVAKGVEQQGMVSLLTRTLPSFIGINVSNEKDFKGKSMIPTQADVEKREQSKEKARESKKEHLLTQDELKYLSSYMKQNAKQQTQNMSNKQKMDVANNNAILYENKKEDIINKRK